MNRKVQPYSKSHARRMKQREKNALPVDELQDVLATVPMEEEEAPPLTIGEASASDAKRKQSAAPEPSMKQTRVTQAQRQRALCVDVNTLECFAHTEGRVDAKARLPQLLKHEAFTSDPWAAIKLHAQNTLPAKNNVKKSKR